MKFIFMLFTFFCSYCSAHTTSFRALTDVQIWNVTSSPPTIVFQTSAEFHQTTCQYLQKAAHLVVSVNSSVVSPPFITNAENDRKYRWALLIADINLSASEIKNVFVKAAKHGYLAVILATEKHAKDIFSSNKDWVSLLDGEFIDGYLVNPWDFKILSKFSYPINSEYSSIIFQPRRVLYSDSRTRYYDDVCKEEYLKPFHDRQYNSRSPFLWTILRTLDITVEKLIEAYYVNWARSLLQLLLLAVSYKVIQDSRDKIRENKNLKVEITKLQNNPPKCRGCSTKARVVSDLKSFHAAVHHFLLDNFNCYICKEIVLNGLETVCCKQNACADCYSERKSSIGSQCPFCPAQVTEEPLLSHALNEELDEILARMPVRKKRILKGCVA